MKYFIPLSYNTHIDSHCNYNSSATATANQQKDFFTGSKRVEFPGGAGLLQVDVSFEVVVDDILESNEGFIIILELDADASDPNAVPEVMITRNTTLARIMNDDCKYNNNIILVYVLCNINCVDHYSLSPEH